MSQKILVVDDDRSVIRLVESILSTAGYQVFSAADGLEALVQIKKESPDLVVLDVEMPEINGYDVCYQLRFNEEFERIPIVLLTVRNKELDDVIGKKVNIEYAAKPLNPDVLLEKIEALLKK